MKSLSIITAAIIIISVSCSPGKTLGVSKTRTTSGYDTTLYNLNFGEGVRQKMLGNVGDAVAYFEKAIAINPESDAAAYEISAISLQVGNIKNAYEYGRRALNIDDQNFWYLNNLATIFINTNQVDSTIATIEKIVRLYPEKKDILFRLGGMYLDNNQAGKAEEIFTQFRKEYGDNEQIIYSLLKARDELGKIDESINLLKEMTKKEPGNIFYMGMLAEQYRKAGKPVMAENVYNELFKKFPGNSMVLVSYADFLFQEGKYEGFNNNLNGLMLNDSVNVNDKVSLVKEATGNKKYIEKYGDQLVLSTLILNSAYKNNVEVERALAGIYGAQGNKDKEIETLISAMRLDPTNYQEWANILIKLNDSGNMEKLYEVSASVSLNFNKAPLPKLLHAFAATDLGKYDEALDVLAALKILINEQPEYMVQILSMEADIYYRQEKYDKAFESFDKALEINPDDPLILNNYAYFLSEQDRNLDKAESMIKHALEKESNNTYKDTFAWVLYKKGRYRKALEIMKEIFSTQINDAELIEHYGFILKGLKRCNEAVEYWKKALQEDPSKEYLKDEILKCTGKE